MRNRASAQRLGYIEGQIFGGKAYEPTSSELLVRRFLPAPSYGELADFSGLESEEKTQRLAGRLLATLFSEWGNDIAAARRYLKQLTRNPEFMTAREKLAAVSLERFIAIEERHRATEAFIRRARAEVRRYDGYIPTSGSWGYPNRRQAMTV